VKLRPKLHYTVTGNGHVQHHQRTSSQQFYNKFATSQCHSPSRHVKMFGMWQIFVRWWCICCTTSCRIVVRARPLVVSVDALAGVRVVEFGTKNKTQQSARASLFAKATHVTFKSIRHKKANSKQARNINKNRRQHFSNILAIFTVRYSYRVQIHIASITLKLNRS